MSSRRIDCAAIIGVGLIGGSFGMALKKRGLVGKVIGIGRSPERLQLAADLGAIDSWSLDLESVISECDLVYISTPVSLELEYVRQVAALAKPSCIITDAGSTKSELCRGVDAILGAGHCFVGGHPMAGSEAAGVDAASPDLFVGATYVLTPTTATDASALTVMRDLAEAIGSRVTVMDPDAHDRCAAIISHLPHIISAALIAMAKEHSQLDPQVFDLVAGCYRDMTRVAGSSPVIWRDICLSNVSGIESASVAFKNALDVGLNYLKNDDSEGFERWFAEAKEVRDTLVAKKSCRGTMNKKISIAIDGPAGSGKTTVAREVSRSLGYKYIDTGAMYRASAWKSLELQIPLDDEDAIATMAGEMSIDFAEGDGSRIFVDGVDVSKAIRTPEVTRLSSPISAISGVRRHLVAQQRRLAGDGGVVMEGRDIGSVVLPDAELKVFLTASIEERARRRCAEMLASGMQADIDVIKSEIAERDHRDSTRSDSPLVKAEGAVEVDTDALSVDQVIERIVELCAGVTDAR